MTRFSNSFWNTELCNFSGFDILCKRMKDGKQMTKDYADFLKLRAQLQESYGKSLLKLAKTAGGKEEVGSLRQAWDSLKQQTENIGTAHVVAANTVIEEMNSVLEFMESQREERRKLEDVIRKIQTNIKVLYRKTMECKKICETRCREAEQATQMLDGNRSAVPPKDIEKWKQKKMKAYTTAEQADVNYRTAVDSLEQCRVQWEKETEKTCDQFQVLEEDRIRRLRNSMWSVTNIVSVACVKEDEHLEEVRKTLEKCDIEADILCFIRQRQTGSERPACIEYENYFGGRFEKNGNSTAGTTMPGVMMKQGAGGIYLPRSLSNPIECVTVSDRGPNNNNNNGAESSEALTNDLYDSVCFDDVDVSVDNKTVRCRVLYDFEGRNDEELTLQESDMVTLIQKETNDWWEVLTTDGKKGYYPAAYLEVL